MMGITRYGRQIQLNKAPLHAGQSLPLCRLCTSIGKPFYTSTINDWSMLSIMPTIAKEVCDAALLAFHNYMQQFDRINLYTIVIASPDALLNWCGLLANNAMTMLADPTGEFGRAMGLLDVNSCTLARSLYIVDPGRVIRYADVVREQSDMPDFNAAIAFLASIGSHTP